MEVNKARNMIEHEEEIFSRPARVWFQNKTEQKRKAGRETVAIGLFLLFTKFLYSFCKYKENYLCLGTHYDTYVQNRPQQPKLRNPQNFQSDPEYHIDYVNEARRCAATKITRTAKSTFTMLIGIQIWTDMNYICHWKQIAKQLLFISRIPKPWAIPQLVSAPFNTVLQFITRWATH